MQRVGVLLTLLLALVAGCSSVPSGFPSAPDETGGPAPAGNVGFQPPFLPIVFKLETDGSISVAAATPDLVTPLGRVSLSGGVVVKNDQTPFPAQPADVTQLIICRADDDQKCRAYEIGSGRKMELTLDGRFVAEVERNRFVVRASPGASVNVRDVGDASVQTVYGPARVDVETWEFDATSPDTTVDFESSRSGQTPDLQYDHLTGAFTLINGARVGRIDRYSSNPFRSPKNNIPSEFQCKETRDWAPQFSPEDLEYSQILACVKTAEGDLGYVLIEPQLDKNPIGYNVYSHTWVR